jgi:hypothetical protein
VSAGSEAPAQVAAPRLPELGEVAWRRPFEARALVARERLSAAYTTVYVTPFLAFGVLLVLLEPLLAPVALASFAHAWIIPELFAFRGARVTLPPARLHEAGAERRAQGLLADLLDHRPRELQRGTGLALEPGELGAWLVGEAGALLVRPGGRRIHAFCVRVTDSDLPPSDRIAHLLLALRQDEVGFATVANHAFAGATWRIRRRLVPAQRPALDEARRLASDHGRPA